MGKWTWRPAEIILVVFLAISLVGCTYFASHQLSTGGVQAKWTFTDTNTDLPGNDTFTALSSNENGTVYACQVPAPWEHPGSRPFLLALDEFGEIAWKRSTNAPLTSLTVGPDGSLYYLDKNSSSSVGLLNTLTKLSDNGSYLWRYVAQNGTLGIWAVFEDGNIIVNCSDSTLLGISPLGELSWKKDLCTNVSYRTPIIAPNGTLVVLEQRSDRTFELGLGENGTVLFEVDLGVREYAFTAMFGTISYQVFDLSDQALQSSYFMTALNISDGSIVWETRLGPTVDPEDHPPIQAYADGEGTAYCMYDQNIYAFGPGGEVLWHLLSRYAPVGAFATGGVLAQNATVMKRIDAMGNQVWNYSREKPLIGQTNVIDRDMVYIAGFGMVQAVAQFTISADLSMIIVLVSFDVLAIVSYVIWRRPVKS